MGVRLPRGGGPAPRPWRFGGGALHLTGRVWLDGAQVSFNRFTDTVASQVSQKDGHRLSAGGSVAAETVVRAPAGGELALRGALGADLPLDGGTAVAVSGEALRSKAPAVRLLLGAGAVWRPSAEGGTALGFDAQASGAGAKDAAYSFNLTLRTAF